MPHDIILPFTFKRLQNERFLIVNQSGEYMVLNLDQFDRLLSGDKGNMGPYYPAFKAKHLVATEDKKLAIELIWGHITLRLRQNTLLQQKIKSWQLNCYRRN
jgi:hypothetical protein